jgi:RNA polymerase sigma factor (sigma-70 family)
MTEPTHDLISRCLAGDEQAWYRLVGRHGGLVFATARRAGVPEHGCDDVAQQVFANLARHLSRIRDEAALPAWLITTTKRDAWRWLKANRRGESSLAVEAEAKETPSEADLERHAHVRRALSDLDELCRELLQMLYFGKGTDYEQVSRQLGMPIGSIGPRRQRCLSKLASILSGK